MQKLKHNPLKFILILIIGIAISCKTKNTTITQVEEQNSLIGKWEVVNSTFLPFEHISFCDTLGIGSVFKFKNNGELEVYYHGKKENCNDQQYYKLDSNYIRIREFDMLFNYEIVHLKLDTLKFKIKRVPGFIHDDSIDVKIKSEISISDPNFYTKIKQDGIIIDLVKIGKE